MRLKNHKLTEARFLPSPNYNQRPEQTIIDLIVIHGISLPPGVYGAEFVEDFFCNKLDYNQHSYFVTIKNLKVSAHLLIKRSGDVVQFVPFDKRAWHCGKSHHKGRDNCNDFSIGIEIEGSDNIAYNNVQYQRLNRIISVLKQNYPIENLVGHSDISPERKTDPGSAFDWSKVCKI